MYFDTNGDLHTLAHKNKTLDVIMRPIRVSFTDVREGLQKLGDKGGRAFTITFTDSLLFTYTEDFLCKKVMAII